MSDDKLPDDKIDWDEQPYINDPANPDHFQRVSPRTDSTKSSRPDESSPDTAEVAIISASVNVEEDEPTYTSDNEEGPDDQGNIVLYDEHRHFLAFIKKAWTPKVYFIGAIPIAVCFIIAITQQQVIVWLIVAPIIVALLVCFFVYPIMRAHFWWIKRRIVILVDDWQAKIIVYEPKSRLYNFVGNDGTEFTLSGDVGTNITTTNRWELYIFRQSGGGDIDTKLDQDQALHNLRHILHPEALKRAVSDAMTIASSRGR